MNIVSACKWLLSEIHRRDGMAKGEVKALIRRQFPEASYQERLLIRKRPHWNHMMLAHVVGGLNSDLQYRLTEYGIQCLSMDERAFRKALVK